jgi:hypothetical protein
MIIGLKGVKGSGKDTVAAYLIKQHGFERKALADPLKKSVAALLNIPYHEIDRWKNDPKIHVEITCDDPTVSGYAPIATQTFREFLQRMGDEASKQIWGDNFWNDLSLPLDGYYHGKKIVVTDVRFESDARRINHVGGFVVQVRRPGFEQQDSHRGENLFPAKMVDWELLNSGTIDTLYENVELMLEDLSSVETRIRQVLG